MPIIAKDVGKAFHTAPAGMVQAVCFDCWDLGMQVKEFKGKQVTQHKVLIGWELNENIVSSDEYNLKRYTIYKKYTLSLNDKANLAKDLASWRGKPFTKEEKDGFDLEKLIGVNCFLNIVHVSYEDKTYANISAITPLPRNTILIRPEAQRSLPEWISKIQAKAVSALDAPSLNGVFAEAEVEDNEIPF